MLNVTRAGLLLATTLLMGNAWADPDGQALYKDNCEKCHGDNGMAHTARGYMYFARNFTSAKWQAKRSDEDIYNTITNSPGWYSVMPAFKNRLSDDERKALVKVVRGFGQASAQ